MSKVRSPHLSPIPFSDIFNEDRNRLHESVAPPRDDTFFGDVVLSGIPFAFGTPGKANVVALKDRIEVPYGGQATFFVCVHVVEDILTNYAPGLADHLMTGDELGGRVATYILEYADGTSHEVPIRRRFEIQQARISWSASPFAAVPASEAEIFSTASEAFDCGRMPAKPAGRSEVRQISGREAQAIGGKDLELRWIYALENPFPEKVVSQLVFQGGPERAVLYGVSSTMITDHPLRSQTRKKLRVTIPPGSAFNEIGELDDVEIDLGAVISARRALDYDHEDWTATRPVAEPVHSETDVIVEYAAHPNARLYVGTGANRVTYDLADLEGATVTENVSVVSPASVPVQLSIVDAESGSPVSARVHIHGAAGEYLPVRGRHRKVNAYWFEDNYGEHINVHNQYGYVTGEFEAELPLGPVYIEVLKGFEYPPHRLVAEIDTDTRNLRIELSRTLHWREEGWISADTHVHFLTPSTALLEGAAEGINIVNLLAAQWGEMFSNVADFDGASTLGTAELGGNDDFLVRLGSENRSQVLGHISLLGYSGSMIHPLSTGGPTESAMGDALESSLTLWAKQCIDKNGLVVIPHSPHPQAERAATIVLGLAHAIEMKVHNPRHPETDHHVSPYGLADWYKYLNLGYHIPLVAGSDKMRAADLLGGIRTYSMIGSDRELTYDAWMRAVEDGNTFVTVGPLVSVNVDGVAPGGKVALSAGGGTVTVSWKVESAVLPFTSVEVIVNGDVVDEVPFDKAMDATGSCDVRVAESGWLAVRVRGSFRADPDDIAAHTSAVQVLVNGERPFAHLDAIRVLDQIEGAIAYVDTLGATRGPVEARRMRAEMEAAYNQLHQRMHRAGVFHEHHAAGGHAHDHEDHR